MYKKIYLQGFTFGTTYHYVEDSTLTNSTNIENIICKSLPFVKSYIESNGFQAYNNYSWQTIYNDFLMLTNSNLNENQIKCSLIGVILATSESILFRNVKVFIIQIQKNINPTYKVDFFSTNYKKLKSWNT